MSAESEVIRLTRREREYLRSQNLLVELIRVFANGSLTDMDNWQQQLNKARDPKYKIQVIETVPEWDQINADMVRWPFILPKGDKDSPLTIEELQSYISTREILEDRLNLDNNIGAKQISDSLQAQTMRKKVEIEWQRLQFEASQEMARLQREENELANEAVLKVERERSKIAADKEIAIMEAKQRLQQDRLTSERWKLLMGMLNGAMRTIVLANAELRNNPAAQDVLNDLRQVFDEMKQLDPNVELDQDNMMDIVERVVLHKRGFGDVS